MPVAVRLCERLLSAMGRDVDVISSLKRDAFNCLELFLEDFFARFNSYDGGCQGIALGSPSHSVSPSSSTFIRFLSASHKD